jgi:hypothetical protein
MNDGWKLNIYIPIIFFISMILCEVISYVFDYYYPEYFELAAIIFGLAFAVSLVNLILFLSNTGPVGLMKR